MENAPAVKANEANLEELNKRIVEIKRKIVLKGEQNHEIGRILMNSRENYCNFLSRGSKEGEHGGMGE